MNRHADRAAQWIYAGVWAVLVRWFRVPKEPPSLPAAAGETVESLQPAPAFLSYLKFWFWLALLASDTVLAIGYIAAAGALVARGLWWVALLLLPVAVVLIVVPDIPVYVGLHLRYDTTWYVVSGRSLRTRTGVWVIEETTITFENVQNVRVTQNPLQRFFGLADVTVDTAGGSSGGKGDKGQSGHRGTIEGVTAAEAARLRDLILSRLRRSATAGLGDELHHRLEPAVRSTSWSPQHLGVLREIRNDLSALTAVISGRAP